jgi:competence protein ComEC
VSPAAEAGGIRWVPPAGSTSAAVAELSFAERVRRWPQHVVLAGVVGGLLAGPWLPGAALVLLALGGAAGLRVTGLAGRPTAVLVAVAVAGAGAAADARVEALERTALRPGPVTATVTVTGAARETASGGWRAAARLRGEPVVLRWPRWTRERPAGVVPGVRLAVEGRLLAPDRGARAVRAHATLALERALPTGERRRGAAGVVDGIRDRAMAVLERGPPPVDAALLQGMVLGQDAGLPVDVGDDLRAAGLAHLVAASGSNVLLLVALVLLAGAVVALPLRPRLVVAGAAVVLYVLLAGAGPSIQRAGVMGVASLVALTAGRSASRWYALGLAAAVTLALDPRAVADPGWQMSFVAVLALALLAPRLRDWCAARGAPRGVAEALAVAVCATLATAPVAAAHFGRTSLVAVPANLAAAPAVPVATWLGMAGAAVGQASPEAARPLVALAATPTAYVRWVGQRAARLPGAERDLPPLVVLAAAALLLACVASLGRRGPPDDPMGPGWLRVTPKDAIDVPPPAQERAAAPSGHVTTTGEAPHALTEAEAPSATGEGRLSALRSMTGAEDASAVRDVARSVTGGSERGSRRRRGLAVVAVAAAMGGLVVAGGPFGGPDGGAAGGGLRLAFLDVGQGAATLVQGGGASVLVDAGPPGGGVVRRLDEQGVGRLDAVLITHDALDHHGGLAAVRRRHPEAAVLRPRAGTELRRGALRLRVLWPPADLRRPEDPNDGALVLHVTDGRRSALLPADAEAGVLRRVELPDVDVLQVAHHGSADPGLPDLLAATTPELAVIPVGPNPYGHPAAPTLAALQAAEVRIRRTDRDGTVVVDP